MKKESGRLSFFYMGAFESHQGISRGKTIGVLQSWFSPCTPFPGHARKYGAYVRLLLCEMMGGCGYKNLVCCLIDFQLNNAECFFIDKATERGDAVASLSEVNAVRWENRQVI